MTGSTGATPGAARLVVLDFDGTICLGDAPVLSYAHHLDQALPASHRVIEATLALFLEGPEVVGRGTTKPAALAAHLESVVDAADGYAAAASLARDLGLGDEALGKAYGVSRAELAAGLLETWAPTGLAAFLGGLGHGVGVILVTNATSTGVAGQLTHLGLDGVFDRIVTDAGKPDGMPAILDRLRADYAIADRPERLISVGDIWRNDLEPAAAQGSATALIERFATPEARPTFRAPTFEALYGDIAEWATRA